MLVAQREDVGPHGPSLALGARQNLRSRCGYSIYHRRGCESFVSLAVADSVFYPSSEYNSQPNRETGSVRISTLLSKSVDGLTHRRGGAAVARSFGRRRQHCP
jgi:hypothetical protein